MGQARLGPAAAVLAALVGAACSLAHPCSSHSRLRMSGWLGSPGFSAGLLCCRASKSATPCHNLLVELLQHCVPVQRSVSQARACGHQ